jgi:hypothetical protein
MKNGTKASEISNIVNNTLFSPLETGVQLSTDHRYLVNEEFKIFLHMAGQLSRNFESGNFDGRNEFACKCSKVIIDALEKADLYTRKYWEDRYDEVIEDSYN